MFESFPQNNESPKNSKLEKAKKAITTGALATLGLGSLTSDAEAQNIEKDEGDKNKIEMTTALPARKDSLDLLNNTKQLLSYYDKYDTEKVEKNTKDVFEHMEEHQKFVKGMLESDATNFRTDRTDMSPPFTFDEYYKKVNKNKFKQRESAAIVLDFRAPMGLYDKRITPVKRLTMKNNDSTDVVMGPSDLRGGGDRVDINMYDPLQVTPWDMLSEEQKEERVKKYGLSGTPSDPKLAVVEKQKELKQLGLYKGPIDGIEGKGTKAAWEEYQKSTVASASSSSEQRLIEEVPDTVKHGISETYILPSGAKFNSYEALIEAYPKFKNDSVFLRNFGKLPPKHD